DPVLVVRDPSRPFDPDVGHAVQGDAVTVPTAVEPVAVELQDDVARGDRDTGAGAVAADVPRAGLSDRVPARHHPRIGVRRPGDGRAEPDGQDDPEDKTPHAGESLAPAGANQGLEEIP